MFCAEDLDPIKTKLRSNIYLIAKYFSLKSLEKLIYPYRLSDSLKYPKCSKEHALMNFNPMIWSWRNVGNRGLSPTAAGNDFEF
jgi:hypothetical protein